MFPKLPMPVKAVLCTIAQAGGQGYVVGGAVRDLLLGHTPSDWDLAATLDAEALAAVFPSGRRHGGRYGTLRLLLPGGSCEITPCRTEEGYSDRRHPDKVHFHGNILEDLRRRDFTINAMAYNGEMLIDPFGGQEDLRLGRLRSVGDPWERFREDPLRVLRLFRFCAVLGFQAELGTLQAALGCAGDIGLLSRGRVREEIEKILLSGGPQVLRPLVLAGGLRRYGFCHAPPLAALSRVPADLFCRWWALLSLCGVMPEIAGEAFGFGSRQMRAFAECEWLYRQGPARTRAGLKEKIRDIRLDYAPLAATFAAVSPFYAREPALFASVQARQEPYRLCDLAISGRVLRREGFSGEECGRVLEKLLGAVIQTPSLNRPGTLLALARKLRRAGGQSIEKEKHPPEGDKQKRG